MAERRLRYPLLWLVFCATLVWAVVLLSSPDRDRQTLGLGILLAPIAVFGLLALLYYFLERRRAGKRSR